MKEAAQSETNWYVVHRRVGDDSMMLLLLFVVDDDDDDDDGDDDDVRAWGRKMEEGSFYGC